MSPAKKRTTAIPDYHSVDSRIRRSSGSGSSNSSNSSSSAPIAIPGNYQDSEMSAPDNNNNLEEQPYSTSAASGRSTGTVRRVGDTEAGVIPSSVESFNTARERPAGGAEQPSTLSRASSKSSLRDIVSPDKKVRARPSNIRRASSTHPHKGQEFSAEDEPEEVEEDQRARTASSISSISFSGMRRRSQLLRRRTTQQVLPNVEDDPDESSDQETSQAAAQQAEQDDVEAEEGTMRADSYESSDAGSVNSFTLKDRQQAINQTHPFGIRIWKPALYKKSRSVQKTAEGDIHSAPGGSVGPILFFVNILWVLLFGWWMAAITAFAGITCFIFFFSYSNRQYGMVLIGLAYYLLYPFGRFVELKQDESYAEEDEGEGRSISEYEQWQAGDIEAGRTFFGPHTQRSIVGRRRDSIDTVSEAESLLGAGERTGLITGVTVGSERKTRFFGRGQWSFGRVLFYAWFYAVIAPMLLLVSGACWLLVFSIPMAKVTSLLLDHLRRHPLALSFHSDHTWSRRPGTPSTSILLCTYRAVGWKYYKYTVDGTNIFFINLLGVVIFVIADYYILRGLLAPSGLTAPATIFTLALCSVIPLAYFIGQAVASISAQSSMGMGATINAFFSTIVEVYLYCVALSEGKGRLVEGSIVGSIFAGVVFMPGISMCSGAIIRKTQRFNAKSAGVTSTMLLFSVIAAFAPTLFYQIYGSYELSCVSCQSLGTPYDADCRRCAFYQTPPTPGDRFYKQAVQPYVWISAAFLFISYVVGSWFTLRTHAALIWQAPPTAHPAPVHGPSSAHGAASSAADASRGFARYQDASSLHGYDARTPASIHESQLYKRILGQSLGSAGFRQDGTPAAPGTTLHRAPPRSAGDTLSPVQEDPNQMDAAPQPPVSIPGLSSEENARLVHGVAEMAAAAAAAAVQDVQRHSVRRTPTTPKPALTTMASAMDEDVPVGGEAADAGGHDAPNWGRTKSSVVLLGATVLYAVIAEILVNTVDVVLENFDIDEKFLGFTLFALVPNTTEFLNAISFAMNGNIALSMEIGSAYALQVCLLQIPALVLFSAIYSTSLAPEDLISHTFSMIFPQWDLVTVILCVFLLSYMYGEGKSNYFKGTILILSYFTVAMGFYFSSYALKDQDDSQIVSLGSGTKGTGFYMQANH
ncbi:Sodium/calcium exchanger protein-domain-containing protein [Tricharina praecox]|uniref:Sodium/calcium exchanger protein-domain-containing protein n=1 Tax=Tricharina praecox TaxID=43433 RepID=UPI00221E8D01|nr:Sodium/calcium exchanger protein-domain-containing protein [Tricharina praecox]KAI5848139.1 Sodium/calcium exchanger protein-domain-containing protein [Tricharina praecox]